ncbi:MAG: zf-HC2 domain-containing protein [Lachnospiraceae bacterium]|nr:zf-HC2 domain-containing protein [Lachnospiraceae bacterium]
MKLNCDLIQDLLPLYQDGICSESSRNAVEEHLQECAKCSEIAEKLKICEVEQKLIQEKESVLTAHEKKEHRYSFMVGIMMAGILMIPVLVCLICNLVQEHDLDWFFIVLSSILVAASLLVVPFVVHEKRFFWTILSFTISLVFLLLVCCVYTKGNWFFVAAAACVFGLSVFFAPYVVGKMELPEIWKNKKGLLVMIWDTLWLYGIIVTSGILVHGGGYYWRTALSVTGYFVVFFWLIFFIIRYSGQKPEAKTGMVMITVGLMIGFGTDVINFLTQTYDGTGGLSHLDLSQGLSTTDIAVYNSNLNFTIMAVAVIVGGVLTAIGLFRKKRED